MTAIAITIGMVFVCACILIIGSDIKNEIGSLAQSVDSLCREVRLK